MSVETDNHYKGYGIVTLFKCLLLQFMEDLSDRELMRYLQENNAAKWFCGFSLSATTPEHTVFCRARKAIGTKLLSKIFTQLRQQLKAQGYIAESFNFVDASHLKTKASLWAERDALKIKKIEKFNNSNL